MNRDEHLCSTCAFASNPRLLEGHTKQVFCQKFGRWEEVRKVWVCADYTTDRVFSNWYKRNKEYTKS